MWVPQLPRSLWWDHSAHYHRWVLRQLPPDPVRVLDVGCGAGRLAMALTGRAERIDGIDRAPAMIQRARAHVPVAPNVSWILGDVLDPAVALPDGGYDAITAISSLHHMPLASALARLSGLLRGGGVLIAVGHYRPETVGDYALELARLPANAAMGAALAACGLAGKPDDDAMPTMTPSLTLAQIRAAATAEIPGARIRCALFWRYLLTWTRP